MQDKQEKALTDECKKLAAHFAVHGFENFEQRAIKTLGKEKAFRKIEHAG